ncbi:MAG: hypothetical protein HY474_02360 [Candidatus Sungbacteria bacterium]|uniref:Uncharacterized protein n=1 Tax=Candidatus Sungiibacteriota bacterium TaxID=2750080 RepID=A0A932YWP4_9BACT|nr:hypothetical protein [Candidatus Sungbacteria bacterium]
MANIISLSEVQRIRGQVEKMRRELEDKTALLERARGELQRLKYSSRPAGKSADERELDALQQQQVARQKKIRELDAAVSRAEENVTAGRLGPKQHAAELKQLETEARGLERKIVQLRTDAAEKERKLTATERTTTTGIVEDARNDIAALEQERETLLRKLRDVEAALKNVKSGIGREPRKALEGDTKRMAAEIVRIRGDAAKRQLELDQKWREIEGIKRSGGGDAGAAEREHAARERERENLIRESREVETAIRGLKEKIAARSAKEKERTAEIKEKESEAKRLESEVSRLRAGAVRAEQTLREMERKLQQARMRPAA